MKPENLAATVEPMQLKPPTRPECWIVIAYDGYGWRIPSSAKRLFAEHNLAVRAAENLSPHHWIHPRIIHVPGE